MSTASSKAVKTPPKDLGSPLAVALSGLGIFLVTQFLAAFIAEVLIAALHPHESLSGLFNNSIPAQFLYVVLAEGLAAAIVIKLVKRRRLGLGFIGLGRKPQWADLKKALFGFGAFYGLLIISSVLLSVLAPNFNTNQPQDLGFNHLQGIGQGLLAFTALVLLPPLGEEPLIRGYLYSGLRARLRFWPALLITSLLFGLAHLEFGNGAPLVWGAGIETFILSVVLVYLRENTGALYAGILVHLLNNAIAFGVHFHG